MVKHYLLLAVMALTIFVGCKAQSPEHEDYFSQDGFFFSREVGSVIPNDTALHQGFLDDSTRYFIYKNEREDYKRDSCIIEQVVRDAEKAVIVVGNIEYEKALRRIEEILQKKDSLKLIPLYSESNYYRFDRRIDIRIPIVPRVHPDLRASSFSIHHFANYCLLSLYTDLHFTELKSKGGLPESVNSVHVYPNLLLDGKDRECLCFQIDAKPGLEEQALKDVRNCLEKFTRDKCTEVQLNLLREQFRQMVKSTYSKSSFYCDSKGRLGNHAILKRIGDAYSLGNELYDFTSEGEYLITSSASLYSEFLSAMFEATILHNPYN